MVRDDLNRGRLVALRLPEFSGGHYDLQAIYRTDMPAERPFNSIDLRSTYPAFFTTRSLRLGKASDLPGRPHLIVVALTNSVYDLDQKWKAACGSCISPIKTAKQPWLSAKAAMPRSKARAGCGSTFAQFTTSPAPTAHELNLKIFWSGARSRRGTWARGKPPLRRDRDYAQRGVGLGSVSAGGFVGNKRPPRGAAL
jgi:hypothetical protein